MSLSKIHIVYFGTGEDLKYDYRFAEVNGKDIPYDPNMVKEFIIEFLGDSSVNALQSIEMATIDVPEEVADVIYASDCEEVHNLILDHINTRFELFLADQDEIFIKLNEAMDEANNYIRMETLIKFGDYEEWDIPFLTWMIDVLPDCGFRKELESHLRLC